MPHQCVVCNNLYDDGAKEILEGNEVKTFVLNGEADYSLFNEEECIQWPWNQ